MRPLITLWKLLLQHTITYPYVEGLCIIASELYVLELITEEEYKTLEADLQKRLPKTSRAYKWDLSWEGMKERIKFCEEVIQRLESNWFNRLISLFK